MRTVGTAAATAIAAVLLLGACGGDGGTESSTSSTPSASTESSAPNTSSDATADRAPAADDDAGTKPRSAAQNRAADAADESQPKAPAPKKRARKPAPQTAAPAVVAGRYVDYDAYASNSSEYADSKVVIFFHAPWCPKCRDTEDSINSVGVPDGLTIVKADFDSNTDLRRRYGVTVQHTYVQVDAAGNSLQKWTGTYGDTSVMGIAAKTI